MRTLATVLGITVLLGLLCAVPLAQAAPLDVCTDCEDDDGDVSCSSAAPCEGKYPGFYCRIGEAIGKCHDIEHADCEDEPQEVCCGCDIFYWGGASAAYDPPHVIPDGDPLGIWNTIIVEETLPFDFLDVCLELDHPFLSDLVVMLEHQDATVTLLVHPECDVALTCDRPLCLSDIGIGPIQPLPDDCDILFPGAMVPQDAAYTPPDPLATFAGMDSAGEWTLIVIDAMPGYLGAICGWSLNFASPPSGSAEDADWSWGTIKSIYR
jgi:hypothetical protein